MRELTATPGKHFEPARLGHPPCRSLPPGRGKRRHGTVPRSFGLAVFRGLVMSVRLPVPPGTRFGRLVVIREEEIPSSSRKRLVFCRCDCGVERYFHRSHLQMMKTRSCGCMRREMVGSYTRTHGDSMSVEYRTWAGIIARCCRPSDISFKNYGARGIKVCDRWRESYVAFFEDMGRKPPIGYSIERIDNNGNYEPGNCKWETRIHQNRNSRHNRLVPCGGVWLPVTQACEILGLRPELVYRRLCAGWSPEAAVTPRGTASRPAARRGWRGEGLDSAGAGK